jgi:hypothetical protein
MQDIQEPEYEQPTYLPVYFSITDDRYVPLVEPRRPLSTQKPRNLFFRIRAGEFSL